MLFVVVKPLGKSEDTFIVSLRDPRIAFPEIVGYVGKWGDTWKWQNMSHQQVDGFASKADAVHSLYNTEMLDQIAMHFPDTLHPWTAYPNWEIPCS
jgi:hypothetical protein